MEKKARPPVEGEGHQRAHRRLNVGLAVSEHVVRANMDL
jgi:hypothetical protein